MSFTKAELQEQERKLAMWQKELKMHTELKADLTNKIAHDREMIKLYKGNIADMKYYMTHPF